MADKARTVTAFCAQTQSDETFTVSVDDNLEYVFTCPDGHFFKVVQGVDIDKYLENHKKINEGQITQELIDKAKAAMLDAV